MTNPTKNKQPVPADILQVQDFLEALREDLSDVMAMEVEEWSDELLDVVATWKDDDGPEPDWQGLRDWLNRICADDGMPPLFPKVSAVAEQAAPVYPQSPAGYAAGKGNAHEYIPNWMQVPALYANEDHPDPLAVIKLFTPWSFLTWYVLEHDGQDLCFGLVVGMETEVGYFSLAEMREIRGPGGLRIERDLWFEPTPVRELPEYQEKWGSGGPYSGHPDQSKPEALVEFPDALDSVTGTVRADPPPWQISRLAYQQSHAIQVADGVPVLNAADGEEHRRQVQTALVRGEPVPDFVLADYPDLVPFEKQAVGEQAQVLLQAAAALVPEMTDENTRLSENALLEIPHGSLTALYPNQFTSELLWTGDTRTFNQAGQESLLRALAYLHGIAVYVREQLGYQVLSVSKAYGADTQVLVADTQVEDSYYEVTLNLWGDVAFGLGTTTPQDALGLILQVCYAGPDLPVDWVIEGRHLDAEIRALLHQAYASEDANGPVFQVEFSQQVQALAAEHPIFQHLKPFKLKSLERFCQSAGLEVRQRRSWKYVLPEKRWLAANLVGNLPARLTELESDPNEKRRNSLLSELADLEQLPVGWITAEQAGKPIPEEDIPDAAPDPEPTPADQAEFQRWNLELLTGRIQPRGAFHKALQQITLLGALRLALDQINGDAERREQIEQRLRQLTQAAS